MWLLSTRLRNRAGLICRAFSNQSLFQYFEEAHDVRREPLFVCREFDGLLNLKFQSTVSCHDIPV